MSLQWPDWIAPNSIDWWLETLSRSGGQTILGAERIIAGPSARWRCTMTFRIWGTQADPSRLLFWRAFVGRLYGRSGSMLIGPFDRMTPARLAGAPSAEVLTPFADGAPLSDGSLFQQDAGSGICRAAAARGQRSIQIAYLGPGAPQAGQYFGVGGANLYLADSVVDNGDATLTMTFAPGLRAAAAIDDTIEFERPRATMRFLTDDGGRAKLAIGNIADTVLDLVETL